MSINSAGNARLRRLHLQWISKRRLAGLSLSLAFSSGSCWSSRRLHCCQWLSRFLPESCRSLSVFCHCKNATIFFQDSTPVHYLHPSGKETPHCHTYPCHWDTWSPCNISHVLTPNYCLYRSRHDGTWSDRAWAYWSWDKARYWWSWSCVWQIIDGEGSWVWLCLEYGRSHNRVGIRWVSWIIRRGFGLIRWWIDSRSWLYFL